MKTTSKQTIKSALDGYAWPGGYPVYLITTDGGALCPACVRANLRQIIAAARDNDTGSGWHPAEARINWEDVDLTCDHCNARIESAYRD